MISGPPAASPTPSTQTIPLRQIRTFTAIYIVLLLAIGVALLRNDIASGAPLGLNGFFIPAILYALAAFHDGRAILYPDTPLMRTRAWSRWMWTAAILFAFVYPLMSTCMMLYHGQPFFEGSEDAEGFRNLLVLSVSLPLVFTWIATRVFLYQPSSSTRTPSRTRTGLALSLLGGGLLVLSSLALDTNYDASGWSIFSGLQYWVTTDLIGLISFRSWSNALCYSFYICAILFALASVLLGFILLGKIVLAPKLRRLLLDFAVLLCWFTVANFLGDYLYLQNLNPILPGYFVVVLFGLITAGWLSLFAVGAFFWFRFSRRFDEHGSSAINLLLLWALPLMYMALAMLWIPFTFHIYGLVTFIVGVQVLAASYWKLARTPQTAT